MNKIINYKCKFEDNDVFEKIMKNYDITTLNLYKNHKLLSFVSEKIRENDNSELNILPFCHTIEAESFGAIVNYTDHFKNPRISQFLISDVSQLNSLLMIDFNKGSINEVLESCKELSSMGKNVMLEISGPLTILNSLIEFSKIILLWRKNSEEFYKILNFIENNLIKYIESSITSGVNIISYADSLCSVDILGDKFLSEITKKSTYPFLKKVEKIISDKVLFHICPKTIYALKYLNKIESNTIVFNEKKSYENIIINSIRKGSFIGQICIKDRLKLTDKINTIKLSK